MSDPFHDDVFSNRQSRHDLAGRLNAIRLLAECLIRGVSDDAEAVECLNDIEGIADDAIEMMGGPLLRVRLDPEQRRANTMRLFDGSRPTVADVEAYYEGLGLIPTGGGWWEGPETALQWFDPREVVERG